MSDELAELKRRVAELEAKQSPKVPNRTGARPTRRHITALLAIVGMFAYIAYSNMHPPAPNKASVNKLGDPPYTENKSPLAQAKVVTGPAPKGDATEVARSIIADNFDFIDCPAVVAAVRMLDGSIKAACSNGESFRVFSTLGKDIALRCSAAEKMGVTGC